MKIIRILGKSYLKVWEGRLSEISSEDREPEPDGQIPGILSISLVGPGEIKDVTVQEVLSEWIERKGDAADKRMISHMVESGDSLHVLIMNRGKAQEFRNHAVGKFPLFCCPISRDTSLILLRNRAVEKVNGILTKMDFQTRIVPIPDSVEETREPEQRARSQAEERSMDDALQPRNEEESYAQKKPAGRTLLCVRNMEMLESRGRRDEAIWRSLDPKQNRIRSEEDEDVVWQIRWRMAERMNDAESIAFFKECVWKDEVRRRECRRRGILSSQLSEEKEEALSPLEREWTVSQ